MAATCIGERAVDMDIVAGRSPISVAAAAIYLASQVCSFSSHRIIVASLNVKVLFALF